uniref:Lipase 1 n=1 Tax=Cacopsylla melanoneura TaxID=428564 RepID=A0A8D8TTB0_9HEMI
MSNYVQLTLLVLTFVTLSHSSIIEDIPNPSNILDDVTIPSSVLPDIHITTPSVLPDRTTQSSASQDVTTPKDDGVADEYKITPKIISQYGYPFESHTVVTQDGYILGIYRIPNGKHRNASDPQKKPVYLQHGFTTSSADWVLAGPNISKAFLLSDEGYDVWLGNIRGNTYSRRHKCLSPDEAKFWDFSFHEMALYDIPATIDYILEKTNNKQLSFIGHAMGSTVFYITSILRPEYNDKVLVHVSLAPINYLGRTRSFIFKGIALFVNPFKAIIDLLLHGEILTRTPAVDSAMKLLCTKGDAAKKFCLNLLSFIFGGNEHQIPASLVPSIAADEPAGISIKSLTHYMQFINSKRFCQYDYGTQNILKYNSTTPPDYNITAIQSKVVLIYGTGDILSTEADILQFYRQLPSDTARLYKVNYTAFTLIDFIYAKDVKSLVDDDLLEILSAYERNEVPNVKSLIPVKKVQ